MAHSAGDVSEIEVVAAWERQSVEPEALNALGLRVVFRGLPSDAGGPDYQDAIIARGDVLLRGDVEFHVRSSDWYRHGHHRNPAYDRVILHVVLVDDAFETRRADGTMIPTLALNASPFRDGHAPVQASLLVHPCVEAMARLAPDDLRNRVVACGLARFNERADRFSVEIEDRGTDQTLYSALLESLGYASNAQTFRSLAESVPLAWLYSIPAEHRLAALLAAAGLGPESPLPPPAHLPPDAWRLSRLRPANHPLRRLEGVMLLLNAWEPRPSEVVADAVCRAKSAPELRKIVLAGNEGDRRIGPGRADEVVASCLLPYAAALLSTDLPSHRFCAYPSPPANRWTRLMVRLVERAGYELRPKTAAEHQGLHFLYHRHCRLERSEGCPVCGSGRL